MSSENVIFHQIGRLTNNHMAAYMHCNYRNKRSRRVHEKRNSKANPKRQKNRYSEFAGVLRSFALERSLFIIHIYNLIFALLEAAIGSGCRGCRFIARAICIEKMIYHTHHSYSESYLMRYQIECQLVAESHVIFLAFVVCIIVSFLRHQSVLVAHLFSV